MGNFMDLSAAIISRLVAAGAGTTSNIFFDVAPSGTGNSYFVINYIAGGEENFTNVDTRNEIWQVKAISNSASTARTMQNNARTALHKQESNLSVSGYGVMWCRAELPFFFNEDVGEQTIWHAGHRYRIAIHESTV